MYVSLHQFSKDVLYCDVCCVDLIVQLTFVLQTQSDQTLTIYKPWEKGVQFSLALNSGPSTSTSLVQGLK